MIIRAGVKPVPQVFEFEFDDGNEEEMARHGVRPLEVLQVLDLRPAFFRNKKKHAATLIMVGPTDGGRFLTVPIAPTPVQGRWRPVTAWGSSTGEMTRYNVARNR
jgi:hypothetical protein